MMSVIAIKARGQLRTISPLPSTPSKPIQAKLPAVKANDSYAATSAIAASFSRWQHISPVQPAAALFYVNRAAVGFAT